MDNLSTPEILILLLVLLMLSSFFAAAETGVLAINRYRLRHMARSGHGGARRVQALLDKPDRFIGLVLLLTTMLNAGLVSISTILAVRVLGDGWGVALATSTMSLLMLIFAEVSPKTLGALYPERVSYPSAYILLPILKITYPIVVVTNWIANGFLRLLGVKTDRHGHDALSAEELRSVVNEAGSLLPRRHQKMLLSILDLEKITVEDIMVPRSEIVGIDMNLNRDELLPQLIHAQHTRLLVYRDEINNVEGFLHARDAIRLFQQQEWDTDSIKEIIRTAYFVPEGTSLTTQLLNFQRSKRRIGLVVDEYGDIKGLVTLEDILEEIVGEFTTDIANQISKDVTPTEEGHFLVEGSAGIRDLNRSLQWTLPTEGPKTLNGLLLEYLETLPGPGTCVRIQGYPMEIMQVKDNMIKRVKIMPQLYVAPRD